MKNSILVAFFLLVHISIKAKQIDSTKMAYTLKWDGQSSTINVKLIYPASTQDSTVFNFGAKDFGGQTDFFKVIDEIKATGSDKLKIDPSASKITVYHSDRGLHELNYRINGSVDRDSSLVQIYRQLFRPVITEGHLYLTGPFFEMQAEGSKADKISVKFTGLPPKLPSFYSWSPDANPLEESVIPMGESMMILISMGKDQHMEKYSVYGIPYYFIRSGTDTTNDLNSVIKPFFFNYFPALRDFWQDYNAKYYYLYLSPLYYTNKKERGGFGWGPGFVMKYNGIVDNSMIANIAHETSHNWIGQKLTLGSNSLAHQWFGEGFNDYVCLTSLNKCGMFSDEVFMNQLNEIFRAHYTSKVNTAKNESIASQYWKDESYQKLPYRRGAIFAFYLDNQIRLSSQGKHTLRDLLLALMERAKTGEQLQLDDFINVAATFLPEKNVRAEVTKYIILGQLIDFKVVTMMPDFKVSFATGVPVMSLNGGNLKNFYKW
jgi:predicted metalloprotease with PDZ domain